MSTANELARVAAGDVQRVELYITDEEMAQLSKDELLAKRAELEGAAEIARGLGVSVSNYRDAVRKVEVFAFFRPEATS